MYLFICIILSIIICVLSLNKRCRKYVWFAYFLSFSAHIKICYVYTCSGYIGKQNEGISVTATEIIGFGLFLAYIFLKKNSKHRNFGLFKRYLIYFLFSLGSLYYSYNVGMSINEIGIEAELLLVIYLISFCFTNEYFDCLKNTLLLNSYVQTIICLIPFFTGYSFRTEQLSYRGDIARCQGLYITPAELALMSLVTFFILLSLYLHEKKKNWILRVAMICNFACILLSQSRVTILVFVMGLLIVALVNNSGFQSNSRMLLGIMVFMGVFLSAIAFFFGDIGMGNSQDMLSSRINMWIMGLLVFFQHPILGVGVNAYTAFNTYFSTSYLRWEVTNPVHNIYILELAETGIIGFFFLFINLYFPLVRYAYKRMRQSIFYEILFVLLFIQLVYSFTGWVFYSPSLRFFNHMIFAFLLRAGEHYDNSIAEKTWYK